MRAFVRGLQAAVSLVVRRVKLPLLPVRPPVWLLVLVGIPLVLFGSVSAMVATSQPIFCGSCHEMGLHYATWRQSAHHEVGCEECHMMPGAMNMFRSKLGALRLVKRHAAGDVRTTAIQGHVPDVNCRRCHQQTPKLLTYHGLKITHREHWDMGVACTYCHDRVVHGPKWLYTAVTSEQKVALARNIAPKHTPTMETCFKCHDGRRAPQECSTCHVTLGVRKPTAFDPAWVTAHRDEVGRRGEQDCERCHTATFCSACHHAADPHPDNWTVDHPEQARAEPARCLSCHLAPAEKKPGQVEEMAFCKACHELRREHKQAGWQQVHGKESLSDPASCQRCHTGSWCSDCHRITRPHPQEWAARHRAEAYRSPTSCGTCHTDQFCNGCHKGKKGIPASHTPDWLIGHKEVARRQQPGCATCHRPDFCQRCHSSKPPASHSRLWLSQHGVLSHVQRSSCDLCHAQSFCDKCHGVIMPHPDEWLKQHPKTASKDQHICQQCHRKEGCQTCHRGALPESHKAGRWMAQHAAQTKQPGAQCALCHRNDFCLSCHGTEMPHAAGWDGAPHAKAAHAERQMCLRCHKEADCTNCHGLQMPHPEAWLSQHAKQATVSPANCMTCHKPGHNECVSCHAALAPSSHQASDWKGQHGIVGASQMEFCALCHGQDACNTCHAKRKVGA